MNEAEQLLNSLDENDPSLYAIVKSTTETHVIIGSDRYITVPDSLKRLAVQYDHNMQTVTFDCPRYWDGTDMSTMNIYINYRRSDGHSDAYPAGNVIVDETNTNLMHFDWVISRNVTEVAGTLTILICIKRTDTEGNEINHWNSELNSELKISGGMECSESIVEAYSDVLEQWKWQLLDAGDSALSNIETAKTNAVNVVNNAGNIVKQEIQNKGTETLKTIPEDYATIDADVKQLKEEASLNNTIRTHFNLLRTGKVYTVKFPLWETSQTSNGEKLDDNAGLVCLPSTATEHRQNDYEEIPLFHTYDCNAHVTNDGIRVIDTIKGFSEFQDTGEHDVFVLGMSYYEKYWIEDGYWYYSRTDLPREGYTLAVECQKKDGSDQGFVLYGKYVTGLVNGNLYSSKGLIPARYCTGRSDGLSRTISYNSNITEFKKRGTYYTGGMLCDYKYIMTTFYLMFATLNSQSIMAGCTSYNNQFVTTVAEENTDRIILTNDQAANFLVGAYVSIGDDGSTTTASDRSVWACHNLAEDVQVLSKETYSDGYTAIVVDATFTTTATTWISTFHWRSGFSDLVNGRTGCPCPNISDLTNGKYPITLNGIELAVGGYEVGSNAFMDIVDNTGTREIYLTNDATKLTTNITTAKLNYTKLAEAIHPTNTNAWNYIIAMFIDVINGAMTVTKAGGTNSGSSTGFADGLYVDSGTSGQREFLLLGGLWSGSTAGLACLHAGHDLGAAGWFFLARLSINGIGVNYAA